jgi:hypothetical protein
LETPPLGGCRTNTLLCLGVDSDLFATEYHVDELGKLIA